MTKRIIQGSKDVGMIAVAFDLFWKKYSLAQDLRRRMSVRRTTDEHSLIEYSLCAKVWRYTDVDTQTEICFAPYGRIEMRALPGEKQRLTQRIVRQWTPSDGPDSRSLFLTEEREKREYEPVVTNEEMEGIFQAFIAYLEDEGYLEPEQEAEQEPERERQIPFRGFPTTEAGVEKWRRSYCRILKMREEYREQCDDGYTDEPNPSVGDMCDALAGMPEWTKTPSPSTVGRIVRAGDGGHLE